MKKPSDSLFLLIKSLNSNEKRYFKIYAARHTIGDKNNYLKLFDAIDKQEDYDEKKIKEKLKKEKFASQLFVVKSYLYDAILKSLDSYNAEHSASNQLNQIIHYIEILYDKALYEECEKMIEKAEKLALKHEYHPGLLEIINWKFKLVRTTINVKTYENELDKLHEQKKDIINKISNYYQYKWLNAKLISRIMKKGWFPRSQEEIQNEYEPIIQDPVFEKEENALSLHAKMLFHNTLSAYFHLKGDNEMSYSHSKKAENIFMENSLLIESNQEDYISCLSNLVFTSMFLGKYQETFKYIGVLKQMKLRSKALQARLITSAYLPEMVSYNISGNLDAGIKLVLEVTPKLTESGHLLPQRDILYLQYNFACIYFKAQQYKKSSQWLFTILNDKGIDFLPDLHTKARILNLMVQTELNNQDLLPYLLRSTYRFLLKQQRLYQFEKIVLNFIRRLPDIAPSDIRDGYKILHAELIELSKNPYEKKAMDFFGFINWLNAKINN